MISYSDPIEIPIAAVPVFDGTMAAESFEVAEPGQLTTTNLIRTTQNWGVNVKWETHGFLSNLVSGKYHIRVLLEKIGVDVPSGDVDLPEIVIDSLTLVPGQTEYNAVDQQMSYNWPVKVSAGDVNAGTYKLVTLLQLYNPAGNKLPVAGLCEGKIIDIFEPA